MIDKIDALSGLDHKLTKGELRELFVSDVLENFLPDQFGIGNGIIINKKGLQSKQTDIIIFDKRIIPPFLGKQRLGVYPVESVLGVIEVKTRLTKKGLLKADKDLEILKTKIAISDFLPNRPPMKLNIIGGLISFYGNGPSVIQNLEDITWLDESVQYLSNICVAKKYTWQRFKDKWHSFPRDIETYEEIKSFIAWFIDNIRYFSNRRINDISKEYNSWMSIYLRN